MRKALCYVVAAAIASILLIGCGGGGGTPVVTTTSRVLAGFVYAKGNGLGGGPEVVITSSANPPSGYFAPSSGTVTLSVANGSLTRSPDAEPFDMSVSNAIVVTAKAGPNTSVSVDGSNIVLNGVAKSLTSYSVDLGPIGLTGTVELITSPDAPSYTPGPPVALQYTINGNAPASPKELFIAGGSVGNGGNRTVSMVALDSNGVINPAATFTVTSTTIGVVVSGAGSSRVLSPGTAAASAPEGDTTITVQLDSSNVTGSFLANFSYGTVGNANITVTPGAAQLLWNTAGAAATVSVDVHVVNQFGADVFGRTVSLTDPGKVSANAWITQAGATAFTAASGPSDATGHFATTLTAPVSAVAGGGLVLTPKGNNSITATVGAASNTGNVKVIRPLSSVTITGPSRVDVGTTTPATSGTASAYYHPTAAVDVDSASAPLADYPSLSLTYTVTNAVGGAPFGNTGDQSLPTVSTAAILAGAGNENRVVAGNTAGQYAVQVTAGVPNPSNIVATNVFGDPTKIFLTPNTNTVNVIPGASGNYSGSTGSQVSASFVLLDSAGHTIPGGELNYTSTFTLAGSTGGNVSSGGANINTFTLTFGPNDGLLTLALNSGVWASAGGNRPFNISKIIGHDNN
jgi:hypothetical protein